jgi:hypothetical protein
MHGRACTPRAGPDETERTFDGEPGRLADRSDPKRQDRATIDLHRTGRIMASIEHFLTKRLKLKVNKAKERGR